VVPVAVPMQTVTPGESIESCSLVSRFSALTSWPL
jgi:hypothetical protein